MYFYIALTLGNPRPDLVDIATQDLYLRARDGDTFSMLTALTKDLYHVAAKVDTQDLGDLFYLTNTVEHNWKDNPGVTPLNTVSRSMSVGDIAVNLETEEVLLCAPVGWTPVTDETLSLVFTTKALIADTDIAVLKKAA